MDSSTISFKASNGSFVGRDGPTNLILARKPSVDPSCKFTVQVVAPGKITLLADNKFYLSRVGVAFPFKRRCRMHLGNDSAPGISLHGIASVTLASFDRRQGQ